MAQEWYYSQNGQKPGPITEDELKKSAATGKLKPTDLIWKEGMDNWVPARSVKGLFLTAQAPVATRMPPQPVKAVPSTPDRVQNQWSESESA